MIKHVQRTAPHQPHPFFILVFFPIYLTMASSLTYYIEEGKSPGTLIGDIPMDSHLTQTKTTNQNQSLIRFNQLKQSVTDQPRLFRISEKTGKLYTTKTLDAETLCAKNSACLIVMDVAVHWAESFIEILEIKIIIQDVNDHSPVFPKSSIEIEFSEDVASGTKVAIPNAVDGDVSFKNSHITYELKKKRDEPFVLSVSKRVDGTDELAVCLDGKLDRESTDTYLLRVVAKDGGTPAKQNVLEVIVLVKDVNDNPPVFTQDSYNLTVNNEEREREPATLRPIIRLSAEDPDTHQTENISFHFSPQTTDTAKSHFTLNQKTGEIFLLKPFPEGQSLTIKLYIEARDGGDPPLTSIAVVFVHVVSKRNNKPKIDVNFVSASADNTAVISEDIKVGSFIAYVKVIDKDAGPNGEVVCDLDHENFQLLSLGPKRYKVVIKERVDRESSDHHELKINCHDQGKPPLHATRRLLIQVMDINDEEPQFSKRSYKFQIKENQDPQSLLGFINVTDPDLGAGGRVTLHLQPPDKNIPPFQISEIGLLSTTVSLDREIQSRFEFQVVARDNSVPSLNNSVSVVVDVLDENDNTPRFTFPRINPFTMEVRYQQQTKRNITQLMASDGDSRENSFLKFKIVGGNEKKLFTINQYTGLLYFSRVISKQDAGFYDLNVLVSDSGNPPLSTSTQLSLILTVNNKTFNTENKIQEVKKADDKIHVYFLILFVLIAIVVSVIMTSSVSVCIIRFNTRRRNAVPRMEVELNMANAADTDQGQFVCHSCPGSSWGDGSVAIMPDKGFNQDSRHLGSRRSVRSGGGGAELCGGPKTSTLVMKLQTATDVIYQEIGKMADVEEKNDEKCKRSKITSNRIPSIKMTKNEWNNQNPSGNIKNPSEWYLSPFHNSLMSSGNFFLPASAKPILQTFGTTGDPTCPPGKICSSVIGLIPNYNQWAELKSTSIENGSYGSHTPQERTLEF